MHLFEHNKVSADLLRFVEMAKEKNHKKMTELKIHVLSNQKRQGGQATDC